MVYQERVGAYGIGFDGSGKIPVAKTQLYNGAEACFLLGGGIEEGEQPEACIKRESLEEGGLDVTPRALVCKGDYYHVIERTQVDFHGVGYFYYMDVHAVIAAPTEPDHVLAWLTVEETKEKLFLPHQIWAVEEVYKRYRE